MLTLDRSLEEILPYLFYLLGITESTSSLHQMDLQIRRKRMLEAIKRLLVRQSLNQPLIIVFEDLHWLDNAKSLELRAVTSLVRLRQHQVREHATRNTPHGAYPTQHESRTALDEAHTMLPEVYHWFTEGFDTKDLQEAKTLLEELSAA